MKTFPGGRRFAFTIMDDTDVATVDNVRPIYRLLEELGFRTTKTVWPVGCPEGSENFHTSETLEDAAYRAFACDLAHRGFEIAFHGATMESSGRPRTLKALDEFRTAFGASPRVHANHAYNRENVYWGAERLDDPILRTIYGWTNGRPRHYYQGHVRGSAWWWGDQVGAIPYVRNLTFAEPNVLRVNPSMPYHDPARPDVQLWFSAADAEGAPEFNALLSPDAQDRLEDEGGACIVATHLGKGYASGGEVDATTSALLKRLAAKNGWFVPVGTLLDFLRQERAGDFSLPPSEWRRMQWRWARDLAVRSIRARV